MLPIRTGYSFRAAVGSLEACAARLKEINASVGAICDRNSTYGFTQWAKVCEKNELRPVYGVEIGVARNLNDKKPIVDYWQFIAKNSIAELNRLVALSTEQFRYEPLLDYEQAINADCFVICGPLADLEQLSKLPIAGRNFFLGWGVDCSKGWLKKAAEFEIPFAARSANVYPTENDLGLYETIVGFKSSVQTWPQHIIRYHELVEAGIGKIAISETARILSLSKATLPQGSMYKPKRPATLRKMCEAGAEKLGVDLTDREYAERLDKELDLIRDKKFEDYFYIIADVCQWARKEMAVGPARGSSAGSLVCYLLEITTIDPLKWGLIFERFIDVTRMDMPDIDIDFSDVNRHRVFEYMERSYGRERVARLGTVALYKPASAIGEAGKELKVPRWLCDKAMEGVLKRSPGDARAMDTLYDTLHDTPGGQELLEKHPEIEIATTMEGHPRHYSQHAAGVLLTQEPILELVAIDKRVNAVHLNKKDAEERNFLKIDALGLTQLSVFEDCLRYIGKPLTYLNEIPLDDDAAFEVLNSKRYSGIFQFNGIALKSVVSGISVESIDDIITASALARPGPLASGNAQKWIMRRSGKEPIEYPHPLLEPYSKETLGIVIYQEQVLTIGRGVGGLSWEDTTLLRKAMSRSLGKEFFDQFGDKFKPKAVEKGIPKDAVDKIWDDLCAYGSWAFNKSHSVSYGFISYWCCYLKAHFPLEFAAATLNHESDPERQIQLLRELNEEGIDYTPIDPELSTDKWTFKKGGNGALLIGPVQNVKGIGPKMVSAIVGARARGEELPERARKLLHNPVTAIDDLYPIRSAYERLVPDPAAAKILTIPTKVSDLDNLNDGDTIMLIGVANKINRRDANELINIQRRGYKIAEGKPTFSLNIRLKDDTGECLCIINRFKFEKLGKDIIARGRPGSAMYAIKGKLSKWSIDILQVDKVKYLGELN